MSKVYPVDPAFAAKARIRKEDYERQYAESVKDPEGFWGRVAERLDVGRDGRQRARHRRVNSLSCSLCERTMRADASHVAARLTSRKTHRSSSRLSSN